MYEYWFMFFVAIIVATTAMTLGVGGALFFSPIFILLFPIKVSFFVFVWVNFHLFLHALKLFIESRDTIHPLGNESHQTGPKHLMPPPGVEPVPPARKAGVLGH